MIINLFGEMPSAHIRTVMAGDPHVNWEDYALFLSSRGTDIGFWALRSTSLTEAGRFYSGSFFLQKQKLVVMLDPLYRTLRQPRRRNFDTAVD